MSDAVEVLERIAGWSPYFRVGTGPVDDAWRATFELRDPATRDAVVSDMAERACGDCVFPALPGAYSKEIL
ncbi:hypothetical protein [Rhodococcus phenolicus]|uniref:hypothetical protein n=1 Tax=Rhodococcus phenolicus TaxID=263849 RepID=UPI000832C384|nr:hypothetical protein [Rhodococcus phenolicus]